MRDTFQGIIQAVDVAWGPEAELMGPIERRHHHARYIASDGNGRRAEIVQSGTEWDIARVWNTEDAIAVVDIDDTWKRGTARAESCRWTSDPEGECHMANPDDCADCIGYMPWPNREAPEAALEF